MTRKVHLRTQGVINLGHTRTYCGKVIHGVGYPIDLSTAVNTFGGSSGEFDATVHGTLVTCKRCLAGTYHNADAPKGVGHG
jgi:hypothetical protein